MEGTAGLLARATAVIGVGSIGGGSNLTSGDGTLFSHVHQNASSQEHSRLQSWLEQKVGVPSADDGFGLPPSAVHSYLRARSDLSAVVLSEDQAPPFANQFTSSRYDDGANVDPAAVESASRQLVRVLRGLLEVDPDHTSRLADALDPAELDKCERAVNGTLVRGW